MLWLWDCFCMTLTNGRLRLGINCGCPFDSNPWGLVSFVLLFLLPSGVSRGFVKPGRVGCSLRYFWWGIFMPLGGSDVSRLFIMRTMVGWPVFSFSYFLVQQAEPGSGCRSDKYPSCIYFYLSVQLSSALPVPCFFRKLCFTISFSVDDNPLFTNYRNRHYFRYLRCTKKKNSRP